jgi:hypothetical protein
MKTELDPVLNGKRCDLGNICPHDRKYLRPPMPADEESKS